MTEQSGYEWDDTKNEANYKKHGIPFEAILPIFDRWMYVFEDKRQHYGETRWIAYGELNQVIFCIVYTERHGNIRLISARKAHPKERIVYHEQKQN